MSRSKIMSLAAFAVSLTFAQSELGNTMRAFEDKPGYVQPVATSIGSIMNTGWVSSARVGQGFGWNFALAVPLTYIGVEDHSYDFRFSTNCAELRANVDPVARPNGYACAAQYDEGVIYNTPTIWGNDAAVFYNVYRPTGDGPTDFQSVREASLDKGNPDLREFTTLGFILPTLSFSKSHFRGTLRIIGAPAVSSADFGGILIWGLGAQYDFTHLLPPVVMEKSIYLSLMSNVTSWSLSYKPTGDVVGELSLDGLATVSGLVAGWKWKSVEVFSELGYETSSLKSAGSLVDNGMADDPNTVENERLIEPRVEVDGRNGLRASLNIALHLGVWQPVVAQSIGAQVGTQVNLIQFGKEGQ